MPSRARLIDGDEVDVIEARDMHKYAQRAGVASKIKRKIRRRERAQARQAIRREDDQ